MPLRVTVGERSLAEGHLELTQRRGGETDMVSPAMTSSAAYSRLAGG